MAIWTNEPNPFGQNRTPGLIGWASDGSNQAVPVAVDPLSGAILTESATTIVNQPVDITDVYLALKEMINILADPPWVDKTNGALMVTPRGTNTAVTYQPYVSMGGIFTSISGQNATSINTTPNYSLVDSLLNPINKESWETNIRERIN